MTARDTAANPILLQALRYAKKCGWQVFPCGPQSKSPATKHGFKDGTIDVARIIAWWKRGPRQNLAVVTGDASRLVVLDVDPRNGGNESLSALEQAHGELPATLMVTTGGGGRHYYFAYPEGETVSCRKVAHGLDLKADGGYVLAPPSVHPSGGTYDWVDKKVPIARCPAWLSTKKARTVDAAESKLGRAFRAAGMLGRRLDAGKRTVVCPWQQEHSTGSAHDSSTVLFPATGRGGLGKFHCSHSHCAERAEDAASKELERLSTSGGPRPTWQNRLRYTPKGHLKRSFGNVVLILRNNEAYADKLRLDEMRGIVAHGGIEVTDAMVSGARVALEDQYELDFGDADTAKAIYFAASKNSFHPLRDYLTALSWDGIPRLQAVTTEILKCRVESGDESDLAALLMVRWFISLVARPLDPGCKVDTALILQGGQGIGKSTFFRVLAGDWFSDTEMGLDKDAMMQLRNAWIYEWAELENVTGRHEVARVKAFLSSTEDRYRPPFGRATVSVKRSGVIVGTTNKEEFLHDSSGSRRFWVLPIISVNVERLRAEREQLLAEAIVLFRKRERWWLTDEEEQRRAVFAERFAEEDPWERTVLVYAAQQKDVRVDDVIADVLQFPLDKRDRRTQMRVAAILRRHGYQAIQARVGGLKGRYWRRVKT